MLLNQATPTPTLVPAPPLDVCGLAYTGTVSSSSVSYDCHYIAAADCSAITKYDFEHLRKPHFWALAALIMYVVFNAGAEGPYRFALRLLNKLRPGSERELRPHSRRTQIAALLMYLGILWLVWIEACMVLTTDWRMLHKVFVVWLPQPTPLRRQLLMLYPAWAFIAILCVAVVALTILVGTFITITQVKCVTEMVMVILGMIQFEAEQQSGLPTREDDFSQQRAQVPEKAVI
ncbi:hypothetical protein NPX13_g438 [Xylaria arbuscula]|uniref:Transmembrane protein n=1 Tax=Xylaria arbuscula TaxID=114810 RepID=A0A9W8TQJ1_9PEZI|nr:hypothetical protein NPX13_g438 [Xylaria arbuscula]